MNKGIFYFLCNAIAQRKQACGSRRRWFALYFIAAELLHIDGVDASYEQRECFIEAVRLLLHIRRANASF